MKSFFVVSVLLVGIFSYANESFDNKAYGLKLCDRAEAKGAKKHCLNWVNNESNMRSNVYSIALIACDRASGDNPDTSADEGSPGTNSGCLRKASELISKEFNLIQATDCSPNSPGNNTILGLNSCLVKLFNNKNLEAQSASSGQPSSSGPNKGGK